MRQKYRCIYQAANFGQSVTRRYQHQWQTTSNQAHQEHFARLVCWASLILKHLSLPRSILGRCGTWRSMLSGAAQWSWHQCWASFGALPQWLCSWLTQCRLRGSWPGCATETTTLLLRSPSSTGLACGCLIGWGLAAGLECFEELSWTKSWAQGT